MRVTSAVLFWTAAGLTATPGNLPAQSAPRIVEHSGSHVTIALPAPQSVVVLGISIYGDIRLLYPAVDKTAVVGAGQSRLNFEREGPWLADGRSGVVVSANRGPTRYCNTDNSMLARIAEEQSGQSAMRFCTWMPNPPNVGLVPPSFSNLVVLGTDPLVRRFPLDSALTGLHPESNTDKLATALSARLSQAGPSGWWVLAVGWHKRKASPCMGSCEIMSPGQL